jgi:hypothetical protein
MPARKPQDPKPLNDPVEYQRFLDMAREVGADETPGALDRAFERVIKAPRQQAPKAVQEK